MPEAKRVIVCPLASDPRLEFIKMDGDTTMECCKCRKLVLVSASSWPLIHDYKLDPICPPCAKEHKVVTLKPMTDYQCEDLAEMVNKFSLRPITADEIKKELEES